MICSLYMLNLSWYIAYFFGFKFIHLFQVGIRSITTEGREQAKKFGVEQYEMRTFSRDRPFLENLVSIFLLFRESDIYLSLSSFHLCVSYSFLDLYIILCHSVICIYQAFILRNLAYCVYVGYLLDAKAYMLKI
jgi:hypothetical protein